MTTYDLGGTGRDQVMTSQNRGFEWFWLVSAYRDWSNVVSAYFDWSNVVTDQSKPVMTTDLRSLPSQ
jgi:hypothetical protein